MIKCFLVCKNIETARKFIIVNYFNTITLLGQYQARLLITVYFAFSVKFNFGSIEYSYKLFFAAITR